MMYGFGNMISPSNRLFSGGGSYNPLTTAWIANTGEKDTYIINSLNDFETGLDTYGLKSKLLMFYPNRTGDPTKDAFDFMNNGARSQFFSSGWTLTTQGAKPNGTSAYADTNFEPRTEATLTDFSAGFSTNENTSGVANGYDMGATGAQQFIMMSKYNANNKAYFTIDASFTPNTAVTNGDGVFIGTVNGSKLQEHYQDGAFLGSSTSTSTLLVNKNVYYGAQNGPANYNNKRMRNVFIGKYLTATEVANLTNLIDALDATR